MGQKSAVDKLPKEFHAMVLSLLNEKWLTQEDIVNRINDEAGKQVISKSSLNRFIKHLRMEQIKKKATGTTKSLERIAEALERIAVQLEKSNQ